MLIGNSTLSTKNKYSLRSIKSVAYLWIGESTTDLLESDIFVRFSCSDKTVHRVIAVNERGPGLTLAKQSSKSIILYKIITGDYQMSISTFNNSVIARRTRGMQIYVRQTLPRSARIRIPEMCIKKLKHTSSGETNHSY